MYYVFDDTKLIVVSFSFTGISHSGANSGFSIQTSFPSAAAVENENLQKDKVEKDVDRKKDDEGELGHIAEE